MSVTRDRSPLSRINNDSDSSEDTTHNFNQVVNQIINQSIMSNTNFTEINLAKEMIPKYEGGSKNLSYFIIQCEKFICTYRNSTVGQENCTLNKLLFELCCSKLTDAARDTLVVSNCKTWDQVKTTLLNRFGDPRNETLLLNDLTTCYQSNNENYDAYFEKIKGKLQQLLEHISIRESDLNLAQYKIIAHTQTALNTFKAGLLEPYRSHIADQTVNSIEECLLQLRNYDNYRQQVDFLNFMRNKSGKQNVNTPIKKPQQFQPSFNAQTKRVGNSNFYPNFNSNFNPNLNQNFNQNLNNFPRNYNQNFNSKFNNQHSRGFPQNGPKQNSSQIVGNNSRQEPTPMSISTRNTFRQTQNRPNNHFQSRGPCNFISEELNNVQNTNEEYDGNYFEFQQPENYETEEEATNFPPNFDQTENFEIQEDHENFRIHASENQ